jgi:FixJ family two-component response regulator
MVYFIDDDAGFRDSLVYIFQEKQIESRGFAGLPEFLETYAADAPNCLLLDLQLEEMHGIEVIKELRQRRKYESPIIIVTGTAEISHAITSMKLGSIDFFEKPVNPNQLIAAVKSALIADSERVIRRSALDDIRRRISTLTARERELIPLICNGEPNKVIASNLHLSMKTVFKHRASLIEKMDAANTADLVRILSIAENHHLLDTPGDC